MANSNPTSENAADALDIARDAYEARMQAGKLRAVQPLVAGWGTLGRGLMSEWPVAAGTIGNTVGTRPRGSVCLQTVDGRPYAAQLYVLVAGGKLFPGITDSQGFIESIDPSVTDAVLHAGNRAYKLTFREETNQTKNAQSMLNALGFSAGPLDGQTGPRTKAATAYYQLLKGQDDLGNSIVVTGTLDPKTLRLLARDFSPFKSPT